MTKVKKEEVTPEVIEETVVEETPKADSERMKLWKEYVANYKIKNPVKGASKEANGEFKVPPVSFVGKKSTTRLQNGTTRTVIY
jgi:hypothetical protein